MAPDDPNPMFFRDGDMMGDQFENEPKWKHTEGMSQHTRILTKESAVRDGLAFLNYLSKNCASHSEIYDGFGPLVNGWRESADEILRFAAPIRFFIGIIGATGVGKSSAICAILGLENLLPSDDHTATTSVATEISWNNSDVADKRFRAVVQLISEEEWRAEVKILHNDLHIKMEGNDENETQGENNETQSTEDRLTNATQKLLSVYPHLDKARLLEMSVEELVAEPDVRARLGELKVLTNPDQARFTELIEPYVTGISTKIGPDRFCTLSCLVKSLKLYVKSPVLQTGLTVVDLPGSHDSNAARSGVAKNFFAKLDRTIVASRMVRAAADGVALKQLLSQAEARKLQMDGKWTAKHLCYIMTHIDNVNSDKYLTKHPELNEELQEVIQNTKLLENQTKAALEKLDTKTKEEAEVSKKLKQLQKQQEDIENGIHSAKKQRTGTGQQENAASKVERYKAACLRGQARLKELQDTIIHCKLEKNRLETSLTAEQSKIAAKCIQDRNKFQAQIIKEYFFSITAARRARRPQAPVEDLQVFGISAPKFHEVQKKPQFGFPDEESSGIPKLRKWCEDSTFEKREERADAFLNKLYIFTEQLNHWSYDGNISTKLLRFDREIVDAEVKLQMERLKTELSHIRGVVINAIENRIRKNVLDFLGDAEAASKKNIVKTVKGWARGRIHWATFRAIASRDGCMKGSKNGEEWKDYDWNEEIVASYMNPLKDGWETVFHDELPLLNTELKNDIGTSFRAFKVEFIKAIMRVCPQLSDPLNRLDPSFLPLEENFHQCLSEGFEQIRTDSGQVHRLAEPIVADTMKPAYEYCSSQTGKGHFRRSKDYMLEHAYDNCDAMNRKTTDAMKARLAKSVSRVGPQLEKAARILVESYRDVVNNMLDQNTAAGNRTSGRSHMRLGTKELRTIVTNDCVTLAEAWKKGLVVPEPEEDIKSVKDEDDEGDLTDIDFP